MQIINSNTIWLFLLKKMNIINPKYMRFIAVKNISSLKILTYQSYHVGSLDPEVKQHRQFWISPWMEDHLGIPGAADTGWKFEAD